ncbi:hypothetical protein ACQP1O_42855 (plasmid) [Nocardia sp. CA-151230]|uniref:hypothetical protein n=1 Tax=Nocardia sp. CA-151230 TaxID=3239982 RepID=UPI003D8D0FC2
MSHTALDYVKALLAGEEGSLPRIIGERVWALAMADRDQLLEYLTGVMSTNAPSSREFEVAYEIWLLMGERGVAA